MKAKCATCEALKQPNMTVEGAHLAGMALGMWFAGGNTIEQTKTSGRRMLCEKHYRHLGAAMEILLHVPRLS